MARGVLRSGRRSGGVVSLYAVAALAALAGACGGSDESATPASDSAAVEIDAPGTPGSVPATASATATPADAATIDAWFQYATQLAREGRDAEAEATYTTIAASTSDPTTRARALLGGAVARQQAGDAAGAIAHLRSALEVAPAGSADAVRVGFLLGLRLNEAGDSDSAYRVLARVEGAAREPLRTPLLAEAAKAAGTSGRAAEASRRWQELLATSGVPAETRVLALEGLARLAAATGDAAGLKAWLALLAPVETDAATLYELGGRASALGAPEAAVDAWLRVVRRFPGAAVAGKALADLHAAGIAVDPGDEGLSLYRRALYRDAIALLGPATRVEGLAAGTLAFRLFYLAAAEEDAGQLEAAVADYDRAAAAAAAPGSPYAHRALYWAARVSERLDDARGASARYLALLQGPGGSFTGEARFRAGYVLLDAGQPSNALAAWATAGASGDARVLYWRGRAQELLGDGFAAKASYAGAVAQGGFYALEAGSRLSGKGGLLDTTYQKRDLSLGVDWSGIGSWLAAMEGQRTAPAEPRTPASEFATLGLSDRAAAVILAAADGADDWRLFDLARESADSGLTGVAAQLAARLLASHPDSPAPADLMRAAYPVDFMAILDSEAKANGLDPLFLAALVRQESFWEPGVGSTAGALGLTQVIPETGAAIAKALGASFQTSDLYRPAISLKFGAYYIAGQLRRFGSPAAALAAYNAGPGPVERWLAAAGPPDAASFIEAVDYAETHEYVRLVLEHYAAYLAAWAGEGVRP